MLYIIVASICCGSVVAARARSDNEHRKMLFFSVRVHSLLLSHSLTLLLLRVCVCIPAVCDLRRNANVNANARVRDTCVFTSGLAYVCVCLRVFASALRSPDEIVQAFLYYFFPNRRHNRRFNGHRTLGTVFFFRPRMQLHCAE